MRVSLRNYFLYIHDLIKVVTLDIVFESLVNINHIDLITRIGLIHDKADCGYSFLQYI